MTSPPYFTILAVVTSWQAREAPEEGNINDELTMVSMLVERHPEFRPRLAYAGADGELASMSKRPQGCSPGAISLPNRLRVLNGSGLEPIHNAGPGLGPRYSSPVSRAGLFVWPFRIAYKVQVTPSLGPPAND